MDVIAGLWNGEPFSYDGDHFSIDHAVVLPTPVQEPRIPVIAGGVWPNKKPIQRGAHWDGIVPHWEGDGAVAGETDVEPEEVLRDLTSYYKQHTDEPGEIMLPIESPENSFDYVAVCQELGATWMYSRDLREPVYVSNPELVLERIREGPPTY